MAKKKVKSVKEALDEERSRPGFKSDLKRAKKRGFYSDDKDDPTRDISAIDKFQADIEQNKERDSGPTPFKKGKLVRGAGCAKKGVRKCKMR